MGKKGKSKKQSHDRYIINLLRLGTITWSGRHNALKKARKKVRETSGKDKFYWQCAHCTQWFRDQSSMEVDHIVEVGSFTGDWNIFIGKLYAEDNLQVLCSSCHLEKTIGYNASRKYTRKK